VLAAVVAVILIGAGAFAAGRLSAPSSGTPSTTSAAAGFARDMQVHHDQAVEMALIIRDRSDDADIRQIAYDIATTQARQSGQMYGWLAAWGLPQASPEPAMTWMMRPALSGGNSHEHESATSAPPETMPGYASFADVQQLGTLTGVAAERKFLTLMIAHHRGGVEMAQAVIARTAEPEVLDLARSIVMSQTAEIDLMEDMLEERPAS
jgi:uncharacterized protein (DUF305 family)